MEEEKYYAHYEVESPEDVETLDASAAINGEITEGVLTQGLPLENDDDRKNPDHTELFETLDSYLIYASSKEQIAKAIDNDSLEKSAIAELYTQEIIQKVFALIAGYVQIKKLGDKNEFDEKDITSALKFCWQKITSKENRLFILENMRSLINKEKDRNIKEKLFQALVSSIESDCFEVLLEDKNFAEIHDELVKLTNESPNQRALNATMMLDLMETNFLTDKDSWEEISLYTNFNSFFKNVCNKFEGKFKDIDPTITRAWEEIFYPRLLAWGNLIYSNSLLLPKKQTEN
jgi:hypothetical protein